MQYMAAEAVIFQKYLFTQSKSGTPTRGRQKCIAIENFLRRRRNVGARQLSLHVSRTTATDR